MYCRSCIHVTVIKRTLFHLLRMYNVLTSWSERKEISGRNPPVFYLIQRHTRRNFFTSCTCSDRYIVLKDCFWFPCSDFWWAQWLTTVVRTCIPRDRSPVSFWYVHVQRFELWSVFEWQCPNACVIDGSFACEHWWWSTRIWRKQRHTSFKSFKKLIFHHQLQ